MANNGTEIAVSLKSDIGIRASNDKDAMRRAP